MCYLLVLCNPTFAHPCTLLISCCWAPAGVYEVRRKRTETPLPRVQYPFRSLGVGAPALLHLKVDATSLGCALGKCHFRSCSLGLGEREGNGDEGKSRLGKFSRLPLPMCPVGEQRVGLSSAVPR